MNARPDLGRPTPAAGAVTTLVGYDLFHVARWRVLSADRFVDELSYLHSAAGRETVDFDTIELPDGRFLTTYVTTVIHYPSNEVVKEPYFMVLTDPDDRNKRPTIFVRSDVGLPDVD